MSFAFQLVNYKAKDTSYKGCLFASKPLFYSMGDTNSIARLFMWGYIEVAKQTRFTKSRAFLRQRRVANRKRLRIMPKGR